MNDDFCTILRCRNDLLHRSAVWEEVVNYLNQFLDKDGTTAKKGICTKGEGLTVPQNIVEVIISEIEQGPQKKITEDLDAINGSKVINNENRQERKPVKGKEAQKEKTKRRSSPKNRPKTKKSNTVRRNESLANS